MYHRFRQNGHANSKEREIWKRLASALKQLEALAESRTEIIIDPVSFGAKQNVRYSLPG
jgi:hypothetical protein